jgi:carboxymethylenebutenolidase
MKFLLLFAFFSLSIQAYAQRSCCSTTATAQFARFASDTRFTAAHLAPAPFAFTAQTGSFIQITTADGKDARVFEVKAAKETKNFILMIHEWWGLNDYIQREAENLQKELGDVTVLAVDMYDGNVATTPEQAGAYVKAVDEKRARAIINGVLNSLPDDARIGTIGWCFGGGWSMQAALMAEQRAKACVIYYGMPEMDGEKLAGLAAPVLGIFGKKDQWISPKVVAEFQVSMKKAKKKLAVKSYDAEHAFANPSNPKHDAKAAADAHKRALAFFRKNLMGA